MPTPSNIGAQIMESLELLHRKLNHLIITGAKNMKTLADLDTELAIADTNVAKLKADNDELLAKLAAQPQTADVTAQVEHLQKVDAALSAVLASDAAVLNPPTPIA